MYSPTFYDNDKFAEDFRRIAPSLGVTPALLGALFNVDGEPWYFRGHAAGRGEFSFYLTRTLDEQADRGHPITKTVAWRFIENLLLQPNNRAVRDAAAYVDNLPAGELAERLLHASVERSLPEDVRVLMASAGRRLARDRFGLMYPAQV